MTLKLFKTKEAAIAARNELIAQGKECTDIRYSKSYRGWTFYSE